MAHPSTDLIDKIIGGYEVLELVGKGGMGSVYRARQISLDREVAFKVLSPRYSNDEEFIERFKREARSIAKINHPNILQVYDVAAAEGLHFIAMEFVHGRNLSEILADHGFVEWHECADYIRQAAMGLASAAKANIIHRDIKPDNLMITEDGVTKVSDFGLAKEVASASLTQTGDLMGTPAYMSPEQCDGAPLDTRTDIYSLGGTFYREVTGILPFNAPTPMAIMYKHKHEPLVPPKQYMPNLPDAINDIIIRMMTKKKEERFASMEEVAVSLEAALKNVPGPDFNPTTVITPDKAGGARLVGAETSARPGTFDFGGPGAATVAPEISFEELVAKGDRLMRENRPVAACELWRRALQLRPQEEQLRERLKAANKASTVACLKIGENLLERGKISALRADLSRILQIDPENVDAREKLVALDFMDRQKRTAMMDIRKMLTTNQHEQALEKWKSLPPALRDKALVPTIENLENRTLPCKRKIEEAERLTANGHFDEALSRLEEAQQLDSANDKVRMAQAETQRMQGRMENTMREGYEYHVQRKYDAAITCFEQVLNLCSDHAQARKYLLEALVELARAAEKTHDFDAAIVRWEQLQKRDPENKAAAERLEQLTRKRSTVMVHIDIARKALGEGRYGRSISRWKKALRLQPNSKAIIYGLAEARNRRWRRRVAPGMVAILLLLLGSGAGIHFWFKNLMDEAEKKFTQARRNESIRELAEAEHLLRKARWVPLIGQLRNSEIAAQLAQIDVFNLIFQEKHYYQAGNLQALRELLRDILERAKNLPPGMDIAAIDKAKYYLTWHMGVLLAKQREYKQAQEAFQKANRIRAGIRQELSTPVVEAKLHAAIDHYLEAKDILKDKRLTLETRQAKAIEELKKAVEFAPAFAAAQRELARLQGRRTEISENLKKALEFRDSGRELARAGERNHAAAIKKFAQAAALAEAILKKQKRHWPARKIKKEYEWRKQAGPGMVFLVHPRKNDQRSERVFRAFALDRYEWPNSKNEYPAKNMSFAVALKRAQAQNKDLPTQAQWLLAAAGTEGRKYASGNTCNGNTKSTGRGGPWRAGSGRKARTPGGLYDMTGNIAEWVKDPQFSPTSRNQVTAGGSYQSNLSQCRNRGSFIPKRADIGYSTVGFRAALNWPDLKRDR